MKKIYHENSYETPNCLVTKIESESAFLSCSGGTNDFIGEEDPLFPETKLMLF